MDDVNSQSRAGVNLTHRFSERLRFSSRNFVSYELEPDYSYGYASSRQVGEYFFWQTDNSVGYRWTERSPPTPASASPERTTPKLTTTTVSPGNSTTSSVISSARRRSDRGLPLRPDSGDGFASDSTNQFLLWVPNIASARTPLDRACGCSVPRCGYRRQHHQPLSGVRLNSQMTQQFRVRSFARYGIEDYDTVQSFDPTDSAVEFPTGAPSVSGSPANMLQPDGFHVRRCGLHPDHATRGGGSGNRCPASRTG
jgi:hypothetical protein